MIFRNLDLGIDPEFDYRLDYICRNHRIHVDASRNRRKKVEIVIDGQSMSFRSFVKASTRQYLPSTVFGYYSGPSTRLERLFDRHQDRFYDQLLRGEKPPLRPLFYARDVHSQYVLLAFFSFEKEVPPFLINYLGITSFENATFILKRPDWYKRSKAEGDMFWGAKGVVRGFLEDLYSLAQNPMRRTERVRLPMRKARTEERLYLSIPNWESLRKLAARYQDNVEFFKTLESLYISDLIHELKIDVKKKGVEGTLALSELSDGEQQLLTVLGLLLFTKEKESLFLLDEPDTHLNPVWKLEYMNLLQRVVGANETSHILIVTHDPLMIGGLTKDQVQIFSLDKESRVTVAPPEEDPIGMGVAGLLTSEVFGLPTTLDSPTQKMLDRKRELAMKDKLTDDDMNELAKLDGELERMGFLSSFRDPLYSQFVKALREYDQFKRPALTRDEKEEQVRIAREIVARLKAWQT